MIEIEIDGKKLQVAQGEMIIEAADKADIKIPRFCYHKKLCVAANCRMCLVDVEKSRKPLPACATPVAEGMVIRTNSKAALAAQKSVMEFLLVNHPLDCPVCDQGGQCELQDVAIGYGKDVSRFTEGKRVVKDENIGSLIATDMTRCIHCTRCVRFGEEIAGVRELGVTGRGEHSRIGTYIQESLISEMSGNVIDLCPVGALTSKPFRYRARPWELTQRQSISGHDCIGSHIHIHTRDDKVMRVVPRENEQINETWISDRDRFSYAGLYHQDRLQHPMIKNVGKWQTVSWEAALNRVVASLLPIVKEQGADKIGAVISPNATTEELYLFQKFCRGIGTNNIDHRLQQTNFDIATNPQGFVGLNMSIEAIEDQDVILLLGSNIHKEQPIAGHRVRKASLKGADIVAINPMDFGYNFALSQQVIVRPSVMVNHIAAIAKALISHDSDVPQKITALLATATVTQQHQDIANKLKAASNAIILIGAIGLNHPHADIIHSLAMLIAQHTGGKTGVLTPGANSAGAYLAGVLPHRSAAGMPLVKPGLNSKQIWEAKLPAYLLYGVEPDHDCAYSAEATASLNNAALVVACSAYRSAYLEQHADVILPIAPYTETDGTFVNGEGHWQQFSASVMPLAEAKPGWKVLRVLGNLCHIDGFEYTSSDQVLKELKDLVEEMSVDEDKSYPLPDQLPDQNCQTIERLTQWPIYRSDGIVRRSQPLQDAAINERPKIWLNQKTAQKIHLSDNVEQVTIKQGNTTLILPLLISEHVADDVAYIPAGYDETALLEKTFGSMTITEEKA